MKKAILGSICVCGVLMGAHALAAEKSTRQFYHVSYNGNSTLFLDKTSLRPANGKVTGWSLQVFYPDEIRKDGTVRYRFIQDEYDCKKRTSATTHVTSFTPAGAVLFNGDAPANHTPIAPDSVGAHLFNAACTNLAGFKNDWTSDVNEAVSAGRAYLKGKASQPKKK